ncbi:SIR2 family protein [Flavobacterium sp. JLP]|uniref:SIR2 family protein n=1 Tax=Flavobacterium sp. JLP TaxID=2783793 RepID=UPI00188CEEA8|nr:SIR2 family protein [Flavobacterium sp. JLP]MBF4508614.1 SIR2 family protein [Flavobacterium sp. JLP]
MYIDDILYKIINGQNGFYSFETFILNLLKVHLKTQERELHVSDSHTTSIDAIVPKGFDDFNGSTIIDIKLNFGRMLPRIYFEKLFRPSQEFLELDPKYYLIINGRSINQRLKYKYISEFKLLYPNIELVIWGPEEINSIAYKHRAETKKIVDNIFSLRIEQVIENDNIDWKDEREKIILSLIETFKNKQFALFLGAGVSSSAGMPNWNKLLNSLFVSYLTNEFDKSKNISDDDITEIVDRLNQVDEQSALMAARYLRKGLSKQQVNDDTFVSTITNSLYELRDKSREENSTLLTSITNICMPRQNGARIRSVVTYNFDDLLEKNLSQKSIKHHSIYTDNENPSSDELPIYHVHGFLPEDRSLYASLDKTTLVFSEEGYHHIYSDPYHWSNLIQLYNLKENNCLMIGLSMTDPNLRRLLDISAKNSELNRHFVFMNRLSKDKFIYDTIDDKDDNGIKIKNKIQKLENLESAELFLKRHHKLNEEIMKELSVNVIWYEDYEEIPEILARLNNE